MKDIFFTLLIIWVLWRVFSSTRVFYTPRKPNPEGPSYKETKKEGETTISYKEEKKQGKKDIGGEYVDYEEMK